MLRSRICLSRALRSTWQSIPIPSMTQGSRLIVRKKDHHHIPIQLIIQPQWRDDGNVELKQRYTTSYDDYGNEVFYECRMNVDVITSEEEQEEVLSGLPGSSDVTVDVNLNFVEKQVGDNYVHDVSKDRAVVGSRGSRPDSYDNSLSDHGDIEDEEEGKSGSSELLLSRNKPLPTIQLLAKVPEKLMSIKAKFGNENDDLIDITSGKLEAHSFVDLSARDIYVKKIRSDRVSVDASSRVHVARQIEADQLDITIKDCKRSEGEYGRLRAKMISARSANILVENLNNDHNLVQNDMKKLDDDDGMACVDISSIYITGDEGAVVTVKGNDNLNRKVRIKNNHGHVCVFVDGKAQYSNESEVDEYGQEKAMVELGGVNGSCDVQFSSSVDENDHGNKTMDSLQSMKIHFDSLALGSISSAHSTTGNIELTFDRKIESDLRLMSIPNTQNLDIDAMVSEYEGTVLSEVTKFDTTTSTNISQHTGQINIMTDAFNAQDLPFKNRHIKYVQGYLKNVSNEKESRFDVKQKSNALGKIDVSNAADQALKTFRSSTKNPSHIRPLVLAATNGNVCVESLSWIGAITRRYGMEGEKW